MSLMGLLALYQAISTDDAAVAADQTKLTADQSTDAVDTAAFVAAVGNGAAFISADGKTVDIVTPVSAAPGYQVASYPVAT